MGDYDSSKINHADHLLLDQPLLRLPYELLRKNFRLAHLAVERDSLAVKNTLKETATDSLHGTIDDDDVARRLDFMLLRMRGLKRKMSSFAEEEERLYGQERARAAHLGELADMHTLDDYKYQKWSRTRVDRLIVDYMLRHGHGRSADALADAQDIRQLVDIDTFATVNKIADSLRSGSVVEALAWCSENKKELRKMESNLEFMLRLQQYIELVRTQEMPKLLEAITHAQKFLVPFRETYPEQVKQAAGLLAFAPPQVMGGGDHGSSLASTTAAQTLLSDSYGTLYSTARWATLADLLVSTHHSLLSLPEQPLLHVALSAGLSALKTPACHSTEPSSSSVPSHATSLALSDSVCPICSTELNALARRVPYAHHSKSHVDPDLLLLPSGRAYGKQRLFGASQKAGLDPEKKVKDLRTGELFDTAALKKVYIT